MSGDDSGGYFATGISESLSIRDADIHRVLVDYSTDVLWLLHPDYTIRYVSNAVTALLGWQPDALIGRQPIEIAHTADVPIVEDVIRRAVVGEPGPFTFTLRVRRTDGAFVWVECRAVRIRDPQSGDFLQGVVVTMRDITARKKLEMELATLASTDALTGLANRRALDDALTGCWSNNDQMSLIIGDIDHFKSFNDSFGHQAGDDCLRAVAGVFGSVARRMPRAVAARYGGEELAIVLPEAGLDTACEVADAVRTKVEALKMPKGKCRSGQAYVTVSFGVATAKADSEEAVPIPQSLIFAADVALYRAKREGRNRVAATYPETADRAAGVRQR